jgi:hypothetical protein
MPTYRFIGTTAAAAAPPPPGSAAEPAPALTLEISRGKDGSVLDIALWRGAAFVASIPVGGDFAETDLHRTGRQSLDEAQVALAHKFLAAEAMYAAIGAFLEAHAAVLGAMAPVMLPGDLDRLDTALAAQQIAIWNLTAAFEKANVGGSSGGGGESAPPPVPEATPEPRPQSCLRCRGTGTGQCHRCHGSGLEPVPPYLQSLQSQGSEAGHA